MKLIVISDASGLPLAVRPDAAEPHEVALVQAAINAIVTMGQPIRIIGDRDYDSDLPSASWRVGTDSATDSLPLFILRFP